MYNLKKMKVENWLVDLKYWELAWNNFDAGMKPKLYLNVFKREIKDEAGRRNNNGPLKLCYKDGVKLMLKTMVFTP